MGDLNIDGLKINNNEHVNTIFKTMLLQYFISTITLPNRIVETSISLIDHVIINKTLLETSDDIITCNIYSGITDHLPNFLILSSTNHTKNKI